MIEQIKARITEIETFIAQLVQQHTAATGNLAEARHFLEMAEKGVDKPVDDVAEIVDGIIESE